MLKKGDLVKHFKGKNIDEKNIYEILEVGVKYSGDRFDMGESILVVYKNIFQNKVFVRELEDLTAELTIEKQEIYNQKYRVEKLSDEEIKVIYEKIDNAREI